MGRGDVDAVDGDARVGAYDEHAEEQGGERALAAAASSADGDFLSGLDG